MRDRPGGLTEARLRMARVPEGAELIPNRDVGRAGHPGRQHLHPRRRAAHRRGMLEALTGKLEGGRPMVSVTVGARAPESEVADLLRETEAAIRASRSAAIRSSGTAATAPISSSGPKTATLAEICAASLADRLRERGIAPVIGGI